ncbi:hypothetical protein [Umezakia ovalisporum]|uniref:Uncharacterized protein n=2 Tax=Umezakia ovalisporum TaxID=75695 RepID=A0AA43KEP5_9CYAN|nr:hypothetical protein [Umezakia ovalisporum]MBI1240646.1 hypothetical protein [Nostoc sp. RI_552]MDH6058322.1 hypothetical protein [Umezakia ovalisporum FSS-43]MDH6063914.1 hypothetical protein [Umezakia ovalisporum FSS-62]MDH6067342.1 hypothetical protein [Umezakia ovalisporum APH033B]MDH6071469.1 hypothetical protein [Umezakia ovalisporum CobakiLakeA]
MKAIKSLTSACRYCRHYLPEGRRGGMCQQLGARVQAGWKACSLALPPFAPSWETLEDAWGLPDATKVLGCSQTLATDTNTSIITPVEEIGNCTSQEAKTKVMQI